MLHGAIPPLLGRPFQGYPRSGAIPCMFSACIPRWAGNTPWPAFGPRLPGGMGAGAVITLQRVACVFWRAGDLVEEESPCMYSVSRRDPGDWALVLRPVLTSHFGGCMRQGECWAWAWDPKGLALSCEC